MNSSPASRHVRMNNENCRLRPLLLPSKAGSVESYSKTIVFHCVEERGTSTGNQALPNCLEAFSPNGLGVVWPNAPNYFEMYLCASPRNKQPLKASFKFLNPPVPSFVEKEETGNEQICSRIQMRNSLFHLLWLKSKQSLAPR